MNKNIRDIVITILIICSIIGFFKWEHDYSKETKRISEEIIEVQHTEEIDYLVISDKKQVQKVITDYYKGHPIKSVKTTTTVKVHKPSPKVIKHIDSAPKKIQPVSISGYFNKKEAQKIAMEIIIEKESFSPTAYKDGCTTRLVKVQLTNSKGVKYDSKICPKDKERYSIGYGTLAKNKHEVISKSEALSRKKQHLENEVYKYIPSTVNTVGDYVAVVDIGYNAGHTSIKKVLNTDGTLNVKAYQEWTYFNGKHNKGLEQRRKDLLIFSLGTMDI